MGGKTKRGSRLSPFGAGAVENVLHTANQALQGWQPQQYYPGQLTATPNQMYQGAVSGLPGALDAASVVTGPMQQQLIDTMSGRYMDPEFLQSIAAPGINQALSGINARTNLGGGRGSSLAAQAAARAGAEGMAGALGQERSRMLQAAGMAPAAFSLGLAPSRELRQQGLRDLGLSQAGIDREVQRYAFNQQAPWQKLRDVAGVIGGLAPQTEQVQRRRGGLMGAIQGVMPLAGYALGGPMGGALGGGMGGLFGGGGALSLGQTTGPFSLY